MSAREVIAKAVRDNDNNWSENVADAVLAALREHWNSAETVVRVCDRTGDRTGDVREIIAVLFDDGAR